MYIPIARPKLNRQRGDTMVEVLVAIAVVSLVLGGAYVTTNKSLQATRSAQERSIALKLSESQLERLKGLVATNPNSVFGAGAPSPFCISPSTGLPVTPTGTVCDFATSGTAGNTTEPIFHMTITRTNNDFVLTESWYDVSGRQSDNLQLRYRVYD